MDTGYLSSKLLVKRPVKQSADEEVLEKWRIIQRDLGLDYSWGRQNITSGKREFSLPNNCVPVTKSRLKSLELENQEMKSTVCALNVEL